MKPKQSELSESEAKLSSKVCELKLSEKEAKLKGEEEKPTSSSAPRRASQIAQEEMRLAEAKRDLEVEREWKEMQANTTGKIEISSNPKAKKISQGLVM